MDIIIRTKQEVDVSVIADQIHSSLVGEIDYVHSNVFLNVNPKEQNITLFFDADSMVNKGVIEGTTNTALKLLKDYL